MAFGDIIQNIGGQTPDNGAATLELTLGSTPTEGNLLVAGSATRAISQATPSGWSIAKSHTYATEDDNLTVYYKVAGSGESTSVTFNDSTSGQIIVAAVYEIEGPWNATPLDKTNSAQTSASDTIATGTTGTLSQADEFMMAVSCIGTTSNTVTSSSIDSSFTELQDATVNWAQYSGGYPTYITLASKLVAVTTAENPTFTYAGSNSGQVAMAIIATFKKSAAGGVSIPVFMHHYRQQGMT